MACPVCKMERTHKLSCRPEDRRDHEMYESDFGRSLNAMLSSLQEGIREGIKKSPRVVSIPSLDTPEGRSFAHNLADEIYWENDTVPSEVSLEIARTVVCYLRGEEQDEADA